jgi:hypothetical protein
VTISPDVSGLLLGPIMLIERPLFALAMAVLAAVAALAVCSRAAVDRHGLLFMIAWLAFIAAAGVTWLAWLKILSVGAGANWTSGAAPDDPGPLSVAGTIYFLASNLPLVAGAISVGMLLALWLKRSGARRRVVVDAFNRHRAQQVGAAGEGLVARELTGLGWPMLRNVILDDGGRTVEIDILLRVSDGIVALEVKSWGGLITGTEGATYWVQYISGGQSRLLNPAVQNLVHVRALERFVGDPALSIRGFVVSAGRARFADSMAHIPVPIAVLRDVLSHHVQVALVGQGRIDAAWRRLVDEARRSDARRYAHAAYVAGRHAGTQGEVAGQIRTCR